MNSREDPGLQELLTESPFERFAERVLWLDGIRQSQWADTVFAGLGFASPEKPKMQERSRAAP